MKNTITEQLQKFNFNDENLNQLKEINSFADGGFNSLAKVIDDIFIKYLQVCLHTKEDIVLQENDVTYFKDAKDTLEILHKIFNQNS